MDESASENSSRSPSATPSATAQADLEYEISIRNLAERSEVISRTLLIPTRRKGTLGTTSLCDDGCDVTVLNGISSNLNSEHSSSIGSIRSKTLYDKKMPKKGPRTDAQGFVIIFVIRI